MPKARAIPTPECPDCELPTAVPVADGGRGTVLHRCVNPRCGKQHRRTRDGRVLERVARG